MHHLLPIPMMRLWPLRLLNEISRPRPTGRLLHINHDAIACAAAILPRHHVRLMLEKIDSELASQAGSLCICLCDLPMACLSAY